VRVIVHLLVCRPKIFLLLIVTYLVKIVFYSDEKVFFGANASLDT